MFGKIKEIRRCNIEVKKDGELLYAGKSEDAPEDIINLNYKSIKLESGIVYLEV